MVRIAAKWEGMEDGTMSVGGRPGDTYKAKCTAIHKESVVFAGDGIHLILHGSKVDPGYYEVGVEYVIFIGPNAGYEPGAGPAEAASS